MSKKRTAKEYLTSEVKSVLKEQKVGVRFLDNPEGDKLKYSKMQFVEIYKGYDMLEDLFTVRTYVQKKYDIDHYLFEVLLKLMGMKVFTRLEYSKLPKPFNYKRLQNMVDTGLVNLVADHWDAEKRLYSLNTKGRNIVITFYKHLSGEVPIPEESKFNPMANKNKNTPYDKKKMEVIKQLNKTPIAEHKKFLM